MDRYKYREPRNCGEESLTWRIAVTAGFAVFGLAVIMFLLSAGGCDRGDFKATMVIEGQPAPHAGYNIGPDIWVEAGTPVKLTGAVIWIKDLDPNSLAAGE